MVTALGSLTRLAPDASDHRFAIQQHGPRQLWDEIDAAYRWWIDTGSPSVDRWRFTITPRASTSTWPHELLTFSCGVGCRMVGRQANTGATCSCHVRITLVGVPVPKPR